MRVLIAATMLAGAMAETTGTTATTTTTTGTGAAAATTETKAATTAVKATCTGGADCLALTDFGTDGALCKAAIAVKGVAAKEKVEFKAKVDAVTCVFTAEKPEEALKAATCTGSETGNTCDASKADKATCEAATDRAFKAKVDDTPKTTCKWTDADTTAGTAAKCEGTATGNTCAASVADKATCEAATDQAFVAGSAEVTKTNCVWTAEVPKKEKVAATCTGGTVCTAVTAPDATTCGAASITGSAEIKAADAVTEVKEVKCTFTSKAEVEAAAKKAAEAAAAAAKAAASSAAVLSMIGAAVAFFL